MREEQCHNHAGIQEFQGRLLQHVCRIEDGLTALENNSLELRREIDERLAEFWEAEQELRSAVGQLGFRSAWTVAHRPQSEGVEIPE